MKTKHIAHCDSCEKRALVFVSVAQFFGGSHGRTDISLFLVVIRLVAHGDLLLLDLSPQLAVNVHRAGTRPGRSVVPEDISHVMEQTGNVIKISPPALEKNTPTLSREKGGGPFMCPIRADRCTKEGGSALRLTHTGRRLIIDHEVVSQRSDS